jgi:predicted porin
MSFKKTLAALAVFGAFAGTAMAANVTLYGVVDEALNYTHKSEKFSISANRESDSARESADTLGLESGINAGSRWGFKGTEELNSDLSVAFKLESGFTVDDGKEQDDRLFRREASLSLVSKTYGKLSFGRMGGISSSAGTYDIVMAYADPFDGGSGDIWGLVHSSRYDNMVTYQSPRLYGLQATAQYSFKTDSTAKTTTDSLTEGTSHADRYASFALTGDYGPAQFVFGYEFQDWSTKTGADLHDGQAFFLGGNYDCGFAKTFLMGQYFSGQKKAGQFSLTDGIEDVADELGDSVSLGVGQKGWGLALGAEFPIASGTFTVAGYYVDAKAEDAAVSDLSFDIDNRYIGAAVRYVYPLSKRTALYTGAGYYHAKADTDVESVSVTYKEQVTQAYVGLTHRF